MSFGIPRCAVPPVDRDKDFLSDQVGRLSSTQTNPREEAGNGRCEDGLLGERGQGRGGQRGAVYVAYISRNGVFMINSSAVYIRKYHLRPPIALNDADYSARGLFFSACCCCCAKGFVFFRDNLIVVVVIIAFFVRVLCIVVLQSCLTRKK